MNSWLELPNLMLANATLVIAAMGLLLALMCPGTDRWSKRFFVALFAVMLLCAVAVVCEQLCSRYRDRALENRIALFAASLLSSLLMPMITVHLLHSRGEDHRKSALFRGVLALWLIYFCLLEIAQFTRWIYYFDADNHYFRGPWYPLLLVPAVGIMAIDLVSLFHKRDKLTKKQFAAFAICFFLPMLSMLVQMFFYGIYFVCVGAAISGLFLFAFLLSDQIERYMDQQKEISRQQASIMMLQMRPHFICNTLTGIYYLCEEDPEEARQVTLDFTNYLRKNFTAIAKEDTIPFEEELEHTRAYLNVEKVRFEDRLIVEMDTPCTDFRLPPLTLQPLVENAVKYGASPKGGPLLLSIRTRKRPDGCEIVVEDSGPGFQPVKSDDPHIALDNIRERLSMMCSGTLEISSSNEYGTTVTVFVPYP
ncbi:MAG: histidine kinase [Clostridia bacterium]|nr:histidine kinase [Clostridia bacterium]